MSASVALPTQAGLGLGGVALPIELLGAASDDLPASRRGTTFSTPPKRPARPPLPHNSLSSSSELDSNPSPTSASFPRPTPHRSSRSGSVQHVTGDMISYPVMAARFEAVATAGPEPISPTSKVGNAILSPTTGRQSKGGTTDSDKKIRPRPAPIKTGIGSAGGGLFSPLRQKFSALGGGKDKSVHENVSPTRQAQLDPPTSLPVHSVSSWRPLSSPPSRSPPMDYGELPSHASKPCPPAAAHRRAVSDSPDLFSQTRWRPSARFDSVDPASNRPAAQTTTKSVETLFLSATNHDGTATEHHFGQVPLTVDGGATLRLRSSRRPDELEIGWTCVPGVDALGIMYTTWEISLRRRTGAHPRPISVVSQAETARPRRESSSQSFQSYSMIPTPIVQDPHAGDARGTSGRRFDSRAAVSPTRHHSRARNASSAYESSSYGSISSDASLWAESSSRQGKLSVSSAATSDPEDCYSPIDLTAYGVTPDSTPPAIVDPNQRFGRSSSYAPGMAPFTRPRQFSVDPEAANKNRSFSLTHFGSTPRVSATSHVEGYGEELRMPEYAATGALDPRLSTHTSGWAANPPPAVEAKPLNSSFHVREGVNTVVRGVGVPAPALPIERNPPFSSSSFSSKPPLRSPLSQRRQSYFDPLSVASRPPTDSSTFSGPPLCPLPELPPSIVAGKPSPESRFSIASSLDDLEAIDVQTASIQLVEQRPHGVVSSRWSDHDED